MQALATYSVKGGVGKTTTAVNLAFEAGRTGVRVLVWDLDPQGAATFLLRARPKLRGGSRKLVGRKGALEPHIRSTDLDGVHVVPADLSLRHLDLHLQRAQHPSRALRDLLAPVHDRYDLVMLDCPPSISLASESVIATVDGLLVPVVPAPLASRTLAQVARLLRDQSDPPSLLPILSMVERRRKVHRELVEELTAAWPQLLPTSVPSAAVVERMGIDRSPVGAIAPRSEVALAYRTLWTDVAHTLWPAG